MFLLVDVFYYEDYDILDFFCFGGKKFKRLFEIYQLISFIFMKKEKKIENIICRYICMYCFII